MPPMTSSFPPKQIYAAEILSERQTEVLRLLGDGKTTNDRSRIENIG
jgi:DNA-binding CsgD family transcriptional regulator